MTKLDDLTKDQATVSGKIAVVLLLLGLLMIMGFTSVHDIAESSEDNAMSIIRLEEKDKRLTEKIDRVLLLVEKINDRTRQIEIKQAEGRGGA